MMTKTSYLATLSIMTAACSGCQSTGGWPWQRAVASATTYGVPGPPQAMAGAPGIPSAASSSALASSGAAAVPKFSRPQLSAPSMGR